MKKFIYLSCIALAVSFTSISCSSSDDTNESNPQNNTNGNLTIQIKSGQNAGTTLQGQGLGLGTAIGSKADLSGYVRYMIMGGYQNVSLSSNLSSLNGVINDDNNNILMFTNSGLSRTYQPIPNQVQFTITNYQETQELNQVGQTIIKGKLNFSGKFRSLDVMNNSSVIEESVDVEGTLTF